MDDKRRGFKRPHPLYKMVLLWAYNSPSLSPDSLGFSRFLLVAELVNLCLGANVACMVKMKGFMSIAWHYIPTCALKGYAPSLPT